MKCLVYGEDMVCPKCKAMLTMNIDIGDGYLYDSCGGYNGCGFKRKKKPNGEEVNRLE